MKRYWKKSRDDEEDLLLEYCPVCRSVYSEREGCECAGRSEVRPRRLRPAA